MTTLYVGEGKVLDYANTGSAISAGDVVVMQDTVGIALVDIAATTGVGAVAIEGVFTVPKTTGTAWVMGDNLDWDTSAGEFHKGLTAASGDVASAGIAAAAAASAAATGQIKLLGGGAAAVVT
jgi:predicted RecA/RadA family phage recombinase